MTAALIDALSVERFETYLFHAGYDKNRALRLYAWNLRISAAFYPLLACTEVAIRNCIVARIEQVCGPEWWLEPKLNELLGKKGGAIVKKARHGIEQRGLAVSSGRLTAELSFGFWCNMLLPKYEPMLWNPLYQYFPHLPQTVSRLALEQRCHNVRDRRNRVSHHEPLLKRNLSQDYADNLELLRWISPEKAMWIKPTLEVMRVMRDKP